MSSWEMRDNCNCLWRRFQSCFMLRGVVTGTSSGSPCMDATSFLYTTLAIRKEYPLVIDREQAMINAIEAKLPNLTVPFRAFRILVGGTVPFRSVPFRILVTTLGNAFFFEAEVPVAAGISKASAYAANKEFLVEASHQDECCGFKTDQKGSQQSFEGI